MLPDGVVAVVKRSCPTCELVVPVLAQLAERGVALTIYSQDDPSFPDGLGARDDAIAMRQLIPNWQFDNKRPCMVR